MDRLKKTFVLLILDGWGYKEDTSHNAIAHAHTPHMDKLWETCPRTLLSCSGEDVGLPAQQMGNSEVGHMCLGSGRVIRQSLTRIDHAIHQGDFHQNLTLLKACEKLQKTKGALHIMGLLSPGGVHSHESHIEAAIELAHKNKIQKIYLHAFLDGRDTPPQSAHASLKNIDKLFAKLECGQTVSIIGRYYAMDRDQRWERTEAAYRLITQGQSVASFSSAAQALDDAYQAGEYDEFIKARSILLPSQKTCTLQEGDSLLFMNFRADRARQISYPFCDETFDHFSCAHPKLADFITLTKYATNIKAPCAYPPINITHTLGETLAQQEKSQLRISETEKYAHVTFFFNGGIEQPFRDEKRIIISSPKVASYDLKPEMSSKELTETLIEEIQSQAHDVIICNYPNGDMVGHTGSFEAAVKACEAVDKCIGSVVEAIQQQGGHMIITADHGNVEQMSNPISGQAHTAHTSEPVPCIYLGQGASLKPSGTLADIAPTILSLMGLPIPEEMTGHVLFKSS